MKKAIHYSFLFACCAMLIVSCAKTVPYTKTVQNKFKLNEQSLKKVQFYVSQDIELFQEKKEGQVGTKDGELVISQSNTENTVLIPKATRGVLEKVLGSGKFAVRFESGDGKILIFDKENSYNGQYKLQAESWENGRGKLQYGGKSYFVSSHSAGAILLVKMKQLNSYKKKERVVKGMKVN